MEFTTRFLKSDTHTIVKKSDSALLGKKKFVFYKENTLKVLKNTFFKISNVVSSTYKKIVLYSKKCIILCIVCIMYYVYYTYKQTVLKNIFSEVKTI